MAVGPLRLIPIVFRTNFLVAWGCGDFGHQLVIAAAARECFFFFSLCRVG